MVFQFALILEADSSSTFQSIPANLGVDKVSQKHLFLTKFQSLAFLEFMKAFTNLKQMWLNWSTCSTCLKTTGHIGKPGILGYSYTD